MPLTCGSRIGPYEIIAPLGGGGMGEVYRARDTKLNRDVAIKVLPPAFAQNAARLTRFQREAQILAALNHPNIAAIYGMEGASLVMEFVPGETLRGPLPLEEALPIARQIADALEYAHEKSIIHRDLKPANVIVTPEGVVKVLDFGLAKALQDSPASATAEGDIGNSPTLSIAATQAGMILGTAAYMSPEQAQGKPVDRRADIWAFGVVFCELLTGQRMYSASSGPETLAMVLLKEPSLASLPLETPPHIRQLLGRCLRKDPRSRLRDIGEARILLEEGNNTPPYSAPGWDAAHRPWLAWSVAATLAVGLAALTFLHLREKPPASKVPSYFQIAPENAGFAILSPDGQKVAFGLEGRLWVQSIESGESHDLATPLSGVPFWSPDSRFIGYPSEGKLMKIEAAGGSPQTITDLRLNLWGCGTWNQDDVIVFGDLRLGLFRTSASGGAAVALTTAGLARHERVGWCPCFLPDGRHFIYVRSLDLGHPFIYLGSLDAKPEEQSSKPLVASNSQAVYAASPDPNSGYLLFVQAGTLMAQPFDNRRLELNGRPAPVAESVRDNISGSNYVRFSASSNGVLLFRQVTFVSQPTLFQRDGRLVETVGEPGAFSDPQLSRDGARLAVAKNTGTSMNIWLLDLARGGATTRFTFGSNDDNTPVWSPDGSRIVFRSNREGVFNLYQKPSSGVKEEEVLLKSSENKTATSWSRDGRFLLYTVNHPATKQDIWVLPREGDRKPVPFLITEFDESQAHFSPDGRWVAYTSDESGQAQVYVRSFSMNSAGTAAEAGGKSLISEGIGTNAHWRDDGRELLYNSGSGRVMAVEIATKPSFRAGKPQPLGVVSGALNWARGNSSGSSWDSTGDGGRFLTLAHKAGTQYTVVLNWQAGLKK